MKNYMSHIQTIYVVQAIEMIRHRDEGYMHVFYFLQWGEIQTETHGNPNCLWKKWIFFLKDLLGLPRGRVVDFHINLISNANPISKTPYCFTSVELTKLKKQLDELLEKCFIHSSVILRSPYFIFVKKGKMVQWGYALISGRLTRSSLRSVYYLPLISAYVFC